MSLPRPGDVGANYPPQTGWRQKRQLTRAEIEVKANDILNKIGVFLREPTRRNAPYGRDGGVFYVHDEGGLGQPTLRLTADNRDKRLVRIITKKLRELGWSVRLDSDGEMVLRLPVARYKHVLDRHF